MPLVDLSHDIEEGMITHPGLPGPMICDFLSRETSRGRYAAGVEFHIGRINMVANTGTYVDAPFHRYENGIDLAELSLDRLADLPAVVIRPAGRAAVISDFDSFPLRHKAVLLHTGWDRYWRTEQYGIANPYLSNDASLYLAESGVALVGTDSVNIDDLGDLTRPAHSILLQAGIPICEHLCNLAALPAQGSRFFAVPPKVRRFGTFPVRAFAILD